MRATPEFVAAVTAAVTPLDTEEVRRVYRAGRIPRFLSVKDLDKRYRWDLFWASGVLDSLPVCELADSHIDTVLRQIVKPL